MASRSFSSITSAARSGSTVNEPRNSHGRIRVNTASSMTTIGAMWTRKSLNVRPARLPMMMFGGSPIRVAAPPMLEASTSAMRNGTGLMSSRSQTSRVTGAMSSTVVTLSRNAEATAVISTSSTMIRQRGALGALGGPDGDVLEHAGAAQDPDDDHHAEQQEDDVPVDAGVVGVERLLRADHAEAEHDPGAGQRGGRLRDLLGGDEEVGHHEDGDRDAGAHVEHLRVTPTAVPVEV